MGQANKRGTFEQRKDQAIQFERAKIHLIETARRLRYQQECDAYDTMVWWQIDMSEERHDRVKRKKTESQLMLVQLLGMAYGGGWGGLRI